MTLKEKKGYAYYLKKKYNDISKKMCLIGVTGTNGKTTTTTLIYQYLQFIGKKVTLIGTNGIWINKKFQKTINTTPGIEDIYKILEESYNQGIKYVVMEVSSHGIHQYRVEGLHFKIKLLTNLTVDHLDYHKTLGNYKNTKLKFLNNEKRAGKVLINADMSELIYFTRKTTHNLLTFGQNGAKFKFFKEKMNQNGVEFTFSIKKQEYYIKSNLVGRFNIYNLTAFLSIIYLLKEFDYSKIKLFLEQDLDISGRMKNILWNDRQIIIDFAHTPDGIEQVLSFIKEISQNNIITVIGCGGNRDRTKRSIIGKSVTTLSSYSIITSDNPRFENPELIIDDIVAGCVSDNYEIVVDRKEAIKSALKKSMPKDIIAVLGRGNETHQHVAGIDIPFSDIDYVYELLKEDI